MTHVEGGGVPAGTQLNGIYEIEKRIAMGGMGEVYIGHVVQTGDKVAIKMILPEHANNELILDLFRKEASTLHNLYHEAIVRYYVFSVDPALNRPYLAMEYAEGPALGDRVRTYPMSEAEMSVLLPRVAGGLHAAHKAGIVHRDLSPDNIILVGGDVNRAKIIDFGIAKSSGSEGTLIGSGFAGKLKYVSPEQLGLGDGEVTAQSDIYSLALVLAEAASGYALDMGGSQVEVIEKRRTVPDLSTIPAYIRPLINWMLQPNPSDRPASMEVVANWTPATPTPAAGTSAMAAPMSEATQIAPAGFTSSSSAPSSPPRQMPQATADRPPKRRRRRRGPLPALSLLFSGTAVAGVLAAFVVISKPDLRLPDGLTLGIGGAGATDEAAGNTGNGSGEKDSSGPTNDGTALTADGGDGSSTTDNTADSGGGKTGDGKTGDGKTGDGTTGATADKTAGSGDTKIGDTKTGDGATDGAADKTGSDTGGRKLLGLRDGDKGSGDDGDSKTGDATSGADGDNTKTAEAADATTEPPKHGTPGALLVPLKDGGQTGGGDSGLKLGGGGGSTDVNKGPGPDRLAVGDTGGGDAISTPRAGDAPRLPGGDTPALRAPDGSGGSTPAISGGDATKAPDTGDKSTPSLLGGGGSTGPSLTKRPVAESEHDPTKDMAEPRIARDGPGVLKSGGDTDLADVPKTGGGLKTGDKLAPTTPGSLDTNLAEGDSGGLTPLRTESGSAPRVGGGGGSLTLSSPGAGDSGSPTRLAAGNDGKTPDLSEPKVPSLTGGDGVAGPSLTKAPVSADEKDPVATLSEPKVSTDLPGSISAPKATGGGTALTTDNKDDDLELPRTGVSGLAPTTPGKPGGGTTELAAVAAPRNLPPTINSRAPDTLSADQGKPLNIRLGEFFDEDGAVNLELKIQGDVPNGLTIQMAKGGIAEMFGTPTEYGDYTIKVAAIDSAGLLSDSITVALHVERPRENRALRDYILAYQGGECFLSRPAELGARLAKIEIFASETEIPRIYEFDKKFKIDMGFEADIGVRLISSDQCELVHVLDQVGPQALDNSLVIRLIKDQLVAGDMLAGKIQGGRGARLFLFDRLAGVTDLTDFIREQGGETGFSVPISGGKGPQILIAARPRDGSGVPATASLNQLLAAAQQGKASLALGFFILK